MKNRMRLRARDAKMKAGAAGAMTGRDCAGRGNGRKWPLSEEPACDRIRSRFRSRRRGRRGVRPRLGGGGQAGARRRAPRSPSSIRRLRPTPRPPLRTVAIAEGPRRLLERIGAWADVEPKAQPIVKMEIMDGGVRDAVRLPHLHFDAREGDPLAHMAFNADVVAALSAVCDRLGVIRIAGTVAAWRPGKRVAELGLEDGRTAPRPAGGRRGRRALEAPGARRDSGLRLGLRPVRHRRHDRSRGRSRGRGRAAFPARRTFRHPAAAGPPIEHRLERAPRGRPRARRARPGRFHPAAPVPLHPEARRDPPRLAGRGLPVPLPGGAPLRRRTARARRRRRPCRPPDRRPGSQPRPARRRGARRDDRRRR